MSHHSLDKDVNVRVLFAVCFLCLVASEAQSHFKNVILGQRLCTAEQRLCIRASVDHKVSQQYLELNARVLRVSKPGRVTLRLKGRTRAGKELSAKLVFSVNGRYSQLIKARSSKLRQADKQTQWQVVSMRVKD